MSQEPGNRKKESNQKMQTGKKETKILTKATTALRQPSFFRCAKDTFGVERFCTQ